jgi:hypothetical protein
MGLCFNFHCYFIQISYGYTALMAKITKCIYNLKNNNN